MSYFSGSLTFVSDVILAHDLAKSDVKAVWLPSLAWTPCLKHCIYDFWPSFSQWLHLRTSRSMGTSGCALYPTMSAQGSSLCKSQRDSGDSSRSEVGGVMVCGYWEKCISVIWDMSLASWVELALGLYHWRMGMGIDCWDLSRGNQISWISSTMKSSEKGLWLLGWDGHTFKYSFTDWCYSGIVLPLTLTLALSLADMRMVRWAMPTLILRTPRYRRKSCVWSELRFTQTEGAPALVPPLLPQDPSALIKVFRYSNWGCPEESRGHYQGAGKGYVRGGLHGGAWPRTTPHLDGPDWLQPLTFPLTSPCL